MERLERSVEITLQMGIHNAKFKDNIYNWQFGMVSNQSYQITLSHPLSEIYQNCSSRLCHSLDPNWRTRLSNAPFRYVITALFARNYQVYGCPRLLSCAPVDVLLHRKGRNDMERKLRGIQPHFNRFLKDTNSMVTLESLINISV